MAFSLFSVVSLTVIYRLTINFPELPYTQELKNVDSDEFLTNSRYIVDEIQRLVKDLEGTHTARVVDYKYHKIIGSLVYVDLYAEKESPRVSDVLLSAIKSGKLGNLTVSDEGFELHVVRDSTTACAITEFTCLDKTCIPADQRCDGRRDCPDGSDEHKDHGKCKQHQPIIHQTEKVVFAQKHGSIHLSASIDSSVEDSQIAWSKDGLLLGVGSMAVAEDGRVTVYKKGDKHHIHIINATDSDDGTYKMIVQGMNVEADFEVRITSDRVAIESDECPSGERACKSGHCLPVSQFCDRRVQCPDGDDEEHCSEVQCKSNEFRCESTNVCVPTVVLCDGWKDCHDGSDEKSCSHHRKTYKPHHPHHVKVNAHCQDGSEPEFSLHGSSYCWSNKVCPSLTECVHGLCCPISKTRKRQSECLEGQFKCGTGQCIEENLKCNRKYDCADGSDEITCDYYLAVQKYHAEQQRQSPQSQDTSTHAPTHHQASAQNSIEEQTDHLVCNDQEFRCPYLPNTKCFHYDKLCDGVDDCGDGSDETNCDSNEDQDQPAAPIPPPAPAPESAEETISKCSAIQFECKRDGKCIDRQLECNHKYDCEDGSDETDCEYFKAAMARRGESASTTTEQQQQREQHQTHQAQHRAQHQAQQHQAQHYHHAQQHPAQPSQQSQASQQQHPARPAQDTQEEHRRRLEEHHRREEEHRRRQEEEARSRAHQQSLLHASQVESTEVTFHDEYDGDSGVGCLEHEFQCAIGECIDKRRVCDTRPDCLDASDEQNCSDRAPVQPTHNENHQQHHVAQPSPPSLPSPSISGVNNYPNQDIDSDDETSDVQITVFPSEKEVRDGRDVSFECRARTSDNSVYPTVRWARVGGPLPSSAHDSGGRLTINPVSLSDAGTYICVSDYNGQTVEARATLNVVSYGPQEVSNGLRQSGQCMADEKACGNNECVKNDYVCDGEPDCRDRSDEANCPAISRTCEPNEFKCNNNKCVQKMWLCDGDDDCGDNSDELNCNSKSSDNGCKPTEFQCHDRRQCVPSSFHCDGTNDCHDGSDEVGCVQPTVVDPPQTNLQVPRGSTFSLTCKAVAVPEPYINWRLNWGPVCEPPRCLQTSEGGYGTLTIHDAQPVDQGAYTCEAINVKGRVLATPDCIVRVVDEPRPSPPPTSPPQRATCDTRGAVSPYPNNYGSCDCKSQVTGPNCDQCKPGAFHLSEKSPEGCLKCFCFGVSNDCRSSGYYRTKVSIDYSRGDRDQLELTTSDSRSPFSPQTKAQVSGQAIEFRRFEEARGQTLYWKLPEKFLGDKVTAYGGVLKYTFKFSGSGSTDQSADVILRGNDIALQYKHREPFHPDRENNVEIKIFETSWQRVDGQQATREHLLMTLADLDTLLIKSTYNDDCTDSQLISVNFEYAEPYGQGLTAAEVEQCICPPGYVGTSCEDCAPGYSRTGGGLYLGLCEKCECNGHASQCDKEYGYCLDCQHNTEGDQCERCKPGFVGDARRGTPNDCQPEATRAPCHCNNHSPRGCDSFGRCLLCEHNTEGTHCERCKKGYYGDATKGSPYDCTPCPCPGASDCYLDNEGQVACRICPAGLQGRLCNECAPGYTRSNKPAGRVCEPIGQVTNEDITFVQKPHEGGRPPQPVIDPPHLVVNEGDPAAFRCWVPGIPDCQITWHRDQLGGPLPHGVYQTGNALKIPQSQLHHAGRYICSAANQYGIGQSPPAVLEVKKPVTPPKVDPVRQTVDRDQPARFKCWVPGNSNVQLKWSRPGGGPLPSGVQEQQGILHIPRAGDQEVGQYVCTATDPRDNTPLQSEPVQLNIRDPAPQPRAAPQIDPPNQTVNVNDPAQFRCWVPGQPRAQLKWSRKDGRPLPNGILERDGFLRIDKSQLNDAGEYECTATEPDGSTQMSPSARLNVNQPQAIQPQVDPPVQTVNEGEPSRIRCWVPGHPNIQLQFVKRGRRPLPVHARVSGGNLEIPRTLKSDEDEYICIATDPNANRPVESNPARVIVKSPIRPIIDPAEQTVPEGSPFRIRCYVPGHPSVQLSFRRASGQLNEDADENNGLLAIQRAELSDEGDYICTARDPDTGAPIDSSPATVHVTSAVAPPIVEAHSPQHPVITPQTQTVPEGDPARIQCSVPGIPSAVQYLTFERADGRPLPFGSSDDRGVLTIPSTQIQDSGNYVCVYSPENQHPQKTGPSVLNVTPEGTPPRPVATPPLLSVAPGSPARFNCVAHSDTPARIKWGYKEENGPLPEHVNQDGDDIFISAAGDDNVGEYVCSATNDFGTGVADPVRLEVTEDQEPPTAVVEPRTWNGKPGERHQFRCITTGSPTPKITWTGPDGSPLPHDVTPLEPNILDFSNGRSELNGEYTCTASNPIGEASDHGVVNIGPSLTVKTNPAGPKLIVTVGEPLQVKCEAFGAPGDPEPEVEWLHDPGPERGDLPDDFKPVTISEQFIRHPNVGLGNAGVYTCKGSSAHATATKNIYIEVVEPSRIATVSILGGSSQWFDQGEKGELICTATGSSLVDRLEWEKVDDQLPTDVEEHNEPGLLHFPSFKNSYAGEYRCNGYRNDEIIASAAVHVHSSADADDEPKVEIEPPRVRVVSQGDNIVLKCSVQGAENGEHFKWALLRGGSLVRQLGTEPTLEISKADPSNDFGVYRCNVEDNNGLVIGSAYTAVSVGQQDKSHAQIVKFDDKSDASFTCPIYSVPGSKVEWTYDNGDLPPKAIPNGNKVEIKEFDDASAGTYVCRVSFDGNVVEGFVTAQMFVPDTIIQVLLEVSSESPQIGDRAWFDCKVTGDPSAVISWTKEGNDDLPPNAQVTGGRLLFTDLKEDNAGVYRCVAKTKAGPLQTRTVLNVGSGKRKRKHLGNRRGRRLRHRRRNAQNPAAASRKTRTTTKLFGSWF